MPHVVPLSLDRLGQHRLIWILSTTVSHPLFARSPSLCLSFFLSFCVFALFCCYLSLCVSHSLSLTLSLSLYAPSPFFLPQELSKPAAERKRHNSFLNMRGGEATVTFAFDFASYSEVLRKVIYDVKSPQVDVQLLLPDTNTVKINVTDLANKAFWTFYDFELKVGTVFHVEQYNPNLLDKVVTEVASREVQGPLLGYYVPRLLQWCVASVASDWETVAQARFFPVRENELYHARGSKAHHTAQSLKQRGRERERKRNGKKGEWHQNM